MTESDWLACEQPASMLAYLRGKVSGRQLRLFAVSCCRRLWYLLPESARGALAVAESFADGEVSPEEMAQVRRTLPAMPRGVIGGPSPERRLGIWSAIDGTLSEPLDAVAVAAAAAMASPQEEEARSQCIWLRHIIGNPFRPVSVEPAWMAWRHGTVLKMAQVIYQERQFHDFPILADALEEAGCEDEEILGHCRRRGEHLQGCWLLDLLIRSPYPED